MAPAALKGSAAHCLNSVSRLADTGVEPSGRISKSDRSALHSSTCKAPTSCVGSNWRKIADAPGRVLDDGDPIKAGTAESLAAVNVLVSKLIVDCCDRLANC